MRSQTPLARLARQLLRQLMGALALSSCAAAQTPATPSLAQKRLEEYRKGRTRVYMDDFGELRRYRAANAKLPPPAAGESRIVFFGDSITDVWPFERYFAGKPYVNRGISGQTTPQMLVRFRQDVISLKPKAVVILAGTNDIAGNTGPMTLEETEGHLASMAELARASGIRVVFSSVLPVHNYTPASEVAFPLRPPAKIAELNRWLQGYCKTNNHVYLDYAAAMSDEKGLLRRDLAEDGLHPNKAGYDVMAPLAEKAIASALGGR